VLDYVATEAVSLDSQLSVGDRVKLDQYLTGVRDLEVRLQNNPPNGGVSVCEPGTAPPVYTSFEDHLDQLIDVMVAAITCDSARVFSLMADASGTYRSFPGIGVPEAHHEMSHWGTGDAVEQAHRLTQYQAINAWHVARFNDFLTRLRSRFDSDGTTLLDNCLIYFSSEVADGHLHTFDDLPVLLAGGGQGCVDTGRHKRFATPQPAANLLLGMLDQFGATQTSLGLDGTAVLPDVFL
jgi:hypothetical protein